VSCWGEDVCPQERDKRFHPGLKLHREAGYITLDREGQGLPCSTIPKERTYHALKVNACIIRGWEKVTSQTSIFRCIGARKKGGKTLTHPGGKPGGGGGGGKRKNQGGGEGGREMKGFVAALQQVSSPTKGGEKEKKLEKPLPLHDRQVHSAWGARPAITGTAAENNMGHKSEKLTKKMYELTGSTTRCVERGIKGL